MLKFLLLLVLIGTTDYVARVCGCCDKTAVNPQGERIPSQDPICQKVTDDEIKKLKDDEIKEFTGVVCAICLDLCENGREVIKTVCNHFFHKGCLDLCLAYQYSCPVCKQPLKEVMGQGLGGSMNISRLNVDCPGYSNCKVLEMSFNVQEQYNGTDIEHFTVGKMYPRHEVGYVPDNDLGLELLGYYVEAFKRRFLYVFGHSQTTGCWDVVFGSVHIHTAIQATDDYPYGYCDNKVGNDVWINDTIQDVKALGISLTKEKAVEIGRQSIGKTIYTYEKK